MDKHQRLKIDFTEIKANALDNMKIIEYDREIKKIT